MLDFLSIGIKCPKRGVTEIYPKFKTYGKAKSEDLMIRGSDFYAIWMEDEQRWSTEEQDALRLIDQSVETFANDYKSRSEDEVHVHYLWDSDSGMIDKWHKYCQKQLRDNYHMLDETIIFSNTPVKKEDYASKRLDYPLEECPTPNYDRIMSTLYDPEERQKIEWSIGSIVTGASKTLQKFIVLYGGAGTGKSTVLNIIQQLFKGYYSIFDAKALASSNDAFALESFKSNPLVAIQHDGDLSRIEDNTRINSLVSHEEMTVNEKFKSTYAARFKAFLYMGTNKPVKITDAKSGLTRRLIDVEPSGRTLPVEEYNICTENVKFELGGIAYHCKEVYLNNPHLYDDYQPKRMMSVTNDFYNFVEDSYFDFKESDGVTMKSAWEMYKKYCDDAKVTYSMPQRLFREELKNYFDKWEDRCTLPDGTRVRNYYVGFRSDIFDGEKRKSVQIDPETYYPIVDFKEQESILDKECADCPAQYVNAKGNPIKAWKNVRTTLSSLDTSKTHYLKPPENQIVIDFDFRDENGEKSLEKNIEAAKKWPPTYGELSKSGSGIHLHYIYSGDVSKLSLVFDDNIEVKVFTGNSPLRRKLTKCNSLPIATISSGLPLKGGNKVVDFDGIKNEKAIRTIIKRNLCKEYHSSTRCSMDFIYKTLEDAYNNGVRYDVSDMKPSVISFAANSTNQAQYCVDLVSKMHWKSDEGIKEVDSEEDSIVIFDCEVFPNLLLINWKFLGEDQKVHRLINPSPDDTRKLFKFKLVGFNNKHYDNHILYARAELGYSNEMLFKLSQEIIKCPKGENGPFFGSAYNLSYTDVFDFCSDKKSLKKWEIQLGIHHQELGLPWDQPVDESLWQRVSEYCDNDVLATEAVFNKRHGDFLARQILADITGLSLNTSTNQLSQEFVFQGNKHPQDQFNYRDLSKPVPWSDDLIDKYGIDYDFRIFDAEGNPTYQSYNHGMNLPEGWSVLPFFPGYKYENGISTYLGQKIGEGGRVYAEPGMYGMVALLDCTSQHPTSVCAEVAFGVEYTRRFKEIRDARVALKHKDLDTARTLLDGKLVKYLDDEESTGALVQALKIVINAIYGQTKAGYENPFRDPRNHDNIVAKRGALFMTNVKREVEKRGFTVIHIKTDSIKIPNATPEIIDFCVKYGKEFGYTFEHQATYDRLCLVNDSTYVAKHINGELDELTGILWTATGEQFKVPYVFKSIFSKKPIEFKDMCETFSLTQKGALYLDTNEDLPDVTNQEKELAKIKTKYKKGLISDMTFERERDRLTEEIMKGHDYHFIGKVGLFTPVVNSAGGGELLAEDNGKYSYAQGAKGYRWLESEMVQNLKMENKIDRSYYTRLVDEAKRTMMVYGDLELFLSDDPWPEPEWEEGEYGEYPVYDEVLPF